MYERMFVRFYLCMQEVQDITNTKRTYALMLYCIVYSIPTVIVIHTYSTYIHNEIGVCVVREAVGGEQGGGRAHPGLSEEAAQAHADLHAHHRLVSVLHGARVHQREMVQHLPYIHTHTYIHIHKHSILEG